MIVSPGSPLATPRGIAAREAGPKNADRPARDHRTTTVEVFGHLNPDVPVGYRWTCSCGGKGQSPRYRRTTAEDDATRHVERSLKRELLVHRTYAA
jgi:hypothetical protein